ncbi:hypothetical protein GA0070620_4066 [Micromonospora krabiensis]|uniref:Uncharacterized protein n=1 Tax=Micromonospora krabiensis TaxID=307121 RepID=A0A1C3N7G9_9ACTN|nr:hypothetical protein GA0070620_4066 [Micromonospora krabiensis]
MRSASRTAADTRRSSRSAPSGRSAGESWAGTGAGSPARRSAAIPQSSSNRRRRDCSVCRLACQRSAARAPSAAYPPSATPPTGPASRPPIPAPPRAARTSTRRGDRGSHANHRGRPDDAGRASARCRCTVTCPNGVPPSPAGPRPSRRRGGRVGPVGRDDWVGPPAGNKGVRTATSRPAERSRAAASTTLPGTDPWLGIAPAEADRWGAAVVAGTAPSSGSDIGPAGPPRPRPSPSTHSTSASSGDAFGVPPEPTRRRTRAARSGQPISTTAPSSEATDTQIPVVMPDRPIRATVRRGSVAPPRLAPPAARPRAGRRDRAPVRVPRRAPP